MKKNTRTLLITIIIFAVVITLAVLAYNVLKKNAPAVSFTPTLAVKQQASEPAKAEEAKPAADSQPAAPGTPSPEQTPSDSAVVAEDADDEEVQKPQADAEPEEEKGPVMPNLPLFRLDGTKTTYNDVRSGKPAVINYFASWCPPCKEELPHFQKAYDEYGDEISFIFLDALDGQRETLNTVQAFIRDFPFTGPVFYDQGEFAMTFQTNSLPTTVLLDKEGRVVKGYLGFVPENVLYKDIEELLN